MKSKKSIPQKKFSKYAPAADNILVFLFLIFVCLITTAKLFIDDDVFWHLATGRYIAENRVVPSADVFGFVTSGTKWIPFEWGWDVVTYTLFQLGGYTVLSIFRSLIVVLMFAMILFLFRKLKIPNSLFVIFGLLFCFGILVRLSVRPHIISYLFTTFVVFVIYYYKYFDRTKINLFFAFPFVFLIWANMHMGVTLGIGVFFIFVISGYLTYLFKRKTLAKEVKTLTVKELRKLTFIFIGSLIAMVLTPHFIETYTYAFSHTQMDMLENISEWKSPFDSKILSYYYVKIYIFFLVIGLAVLYTSFKQKEIFPALLYIALAIYSTQSLRFTTDFMIVMFIPVLVSTGNIMNFFANRKVSEFLTGNIFLKVLLLILLIYVSANIYNDTIYRDVLHNQFRETGFGINEKFYPVEMADFIKKESINETGSNPFNNIRMGGYFIWNFPQSRNFIDSRNLSDDILSLYDMIDKRKAGFDEKLRSLNIDYVVYSLPYLTTSAAEIERNLVGHLSRSNDWKLVFWDDKSFLFVRNEEKFKDVISKHEYKYATPTNFIFNREILSEALKNDRQRLMSEISRKKIQEPGGKLINDMAKKLGM